MVIFSIFIGLVVGSLYESEIDEVRDEIKSISTLKINSEDKEKVEITFEEKTRALEVGYAKSNDKKYIEEPETKKDTNKIFHFEEPNLEEIEKLEEKKIEEPLFIAPSIIKEPITQPIKEIIKENIPTPKVIKKESNKPKLAIIIDDMTTQGQINHVLKLGYTVNMAFLPPTSGHKNSAKITNNLEKFMIHLPLQASNFLFEEENTLHIDDDINKIENRIKKLREQYPNTNFLNNHTGSKFTSNAAAMDRLFTMLKKYNYTFLDSKTTAKSVAPQVAKKHNVKMFSRNIFLDNKKDKIYIQNQLKKAIKIAKKNGLAIAIGHPYSITFKTLEESKHLLEGLELVYIQDL